VVSNGRPIPSDKQRSDDPGPIYDVSKYNAIGGSGKGARIMPLRSSH